MAEDKGRVLSASYRWALQGVGRGVGEVKGRWESHARF